ncbi:MAG: hypothetical protein FGM42_06150 [Ilumatobacteraceae bacterium]|nr:hypothetical protein [Ilumatobacteraceae bacterium]
MGRERELAPTNLRVNDRTYPDYELTWTQPSAAAIKPLLDELASYGRTPPRGWSFSYETSVNGGRTWSTYDYQLSDLTSGRIKINGPADQFLVRIVNRNFGFLSPCLTEASNEVSVTKPILGVSCINNAATLSPRNVTIDRSKAPSIAVSWTAPTGAQLQPVLDELKSFGRGDPRQFTFDVQYSTNNGGSWKSLSQELSDAYLLTTSATYRPITATDFLLRVTTVNYGFLTDCKLISETIRYTRPILGASCVGRGAELAPKNLRVDRSIWPLFKLSWTNPSAAQMQPLVDELKTFSKTDPGRWSYRIEISTNGGSTWRVDWPGSTYSRDERGDSIVLDYSWNANAIARVVYTGYGFLTECKPEPSTEIDVSKPALGAACIANPGAYAPRNLTVTRVGTTNAFRLSWTQPNNSQMQPLVDELRALGRPAPARWDYQVEISTDSFNKFYAAPPATLTAALPASVNVIVSPKNFQIRVTNVKFGDLTSCGPNSSNIVEVRTN